MVRWRLIASCSSDNARDWNEQSGRHCRKLYQCTSKTRLCQIQQKIQRHSTQNKRTMNVSAWSGARESVFLDDYSPEDVVRLRVSVKLIV